VGVTGAVAPGTGILGTRSSTIRIENVTWTPLINHTTPTVHTVYALKDYTPELAATHLFLGGLKDPIAWFYDETRRIIGTDFPID